MSVRIEYDKQANLYSIGDDIDGVFIAFASVPGATVEGRVAAVQSATTTASSPTGGGGGQVAGNLGDDFNPADFTDNGDGTFTRTSDGVQGRFTPSGFEPTTAP